MHEVYNGVNQINDVQWIEIVIFCGDFNWFADFIQTNLLCSMPSRRASWLVCLKMVSKCRALISLYYSGIPTGEFLPGSVHRRAGTRVFFPGLMSRYPLGDIGIGVLIHLAWIHFNVNREVLQVLIRFTMLSVIFTSNYDKYTEK